MGHSSPAWSLLPGLLEALGVTSPWGVDSNDEPTWLEKVVARKFDEMMNMKMLENSTTTRMAFVRCEMPFFSV
jgi:hypothetical protein